MAWRVKVLLASGGLEPWMLLNIHGISPKNNHPAHSVSRAEVRTPVPHGTMQQIQSLEHHTLSTPGLKSFWAPLKRPWGHSLLLAGELINYTFSSMDQGALSGSGDLCSEPRLKSWDSASGELNFEEWWVRRGTFFKNSKKEWLLLLWPQEDLLFSVFPWFLITA